MLLELHPQVLPHNFSISILTLLGVGSPPPNPVPWIQHMSLLLVVQSIRIPMIYEWNIYPIGMVNIPLSMVNIPLISHSIPPQWYLLKNIIKSHEKSPVCLVNLKPFFWVNPHEITRAEPTSAAWLLQQLPNLGGLNLLGLTMVYGMSLVIFLIWFLKQLITGGPLTSGGSSLE